mmetsp:Transcript_17485/g.34809  ORF Transcript_17485/g.34809 Transcript_17485/m.34809 type:complete len:278 (-) Transcript_17485:65-898(-)
MQVLRSDLRPDVSVKPGDGPRFAVEFSQALLVSRKIDLYAFLPQIDTGDVKDLLSADHGHANLAHVGSLTRDDYPPVLWVGSKTVNVQPSDSLVLFPEVAIGEQNAPVLCDGRDDAGILRVIRFIFAQIHIDRDLTRLVVSFRLHGEFVHLSTRSVLQCDGPGLVGGPGDDAVAIRMLLIPKDSIKVELGGGFIIRFGGGWCVGTLGCRQGIIRDTGDYRGRCRRHRRHKCFSSGHGIQFGGHLRGVVYHIECGRPVLGKERDDEDRDGGRELSNHW